MTLANQEEPSILTKQDIIMGNYSSFIAKKAVPDRIRPFTEDDVKNVRNEFQQDNGGTFFLDLEGRRHQVELGLCLCIGTSAQDRRTTSKAKVDLYRSPISGTDEEGFRLYQLKQARHLTCFDIPHAFDLDNENGTQLWQCRHSTGGYVVWDGQLTHSMRVIQRDIFEQTYERVQET
jgi:hypothetical protein